MLLLSTLCGGAALASATDAADTGSAGAADSGSAAVDTTEADTTATDADATDCVLMAPDETDPGALLVEWGTSSDGSRALSLRLRAPASSATLRFTAHARLSYGTADITWTESLAPTPGDWSDHALTLPPAATALSTDQATWLSSIAVHVIATNSAGQRTLAARAPGLRALDVGGSSPQFFTTTEALEQLPAGTSETIDVAALGMSRDASSGIITDADGAVVVFMPSDARRVEVAP